MAGFGWNWSHGNNVQRQPLNQRSNFLSSRRSLNGSPIPNQNLNPNPNSSALAQMDPFDRSMLNQQLLVAVRNSYFAGRVSHQPNTPLKAIPSLERSDNVSICAREICMSFVGQADRMIAGMDSSEVPREYVTRPFLSQLEKPVPQEVPREYVTRPFLSQLEKPVPLEIPREYVTRSFLSQLEKPIPQLVGLGKKKQPDLELELKL